MVAPTGTSTAFGIKINFDKRQGDPSRVFVAMTGLVRACQDMDRELIKSVPVQIEPILLLEDIEKGSLIAWFKNTFKQQENSFQSVNGENLSKYLVEAKYALVDYTNDTTTVTSAGITEVQMKIFEILSVQKPAPDILFHVPVPQKDLIAGMQQFQNALLPLDKNTDEVEYITASQKRTSFNLSLNITPDSIEELLVKETFENIATMILKIKKPDYLGSSQWEFKYGEKTILVKLADSSWLEKFQNREVTLAPSDSIKAKVNIITKYDIDNDPISTQYTLLEVLEVIPASDNFRQPPFFPINE